MVTLLKSISLPRIIKASTPVYFRTKLATSDKVCKFNVNSETQLWRNIKEHGSIVDTSAGEDFFVESLDDLRQALQVMNNFLSSLCAAGLWFVVVIAKGVKERSKVHKLILSTYLHLSLTICCYSHAVMPCKFVFLS